jgi:hypothetical protein
MSAARRPRECHSPNTAVTAERTATPSSQGRELPRRLGAGSSRARLRSRIALAAGISSRLRLLDGADGKCSE